MSAFTHGFNHGFMHGMLNNLLGVGWCNPFMCWNSAPMFFTPSYNFGGFYRYQMPMSTYNSLFNYGMPAHSSLASIRSLPEFDYSWKNLSYLRNDSDLSYGWGDLFVKRGVSETKIDTDTKKYSDNDVFDSANNATKLKDKWCKVNPNLTQEFYDKVVQISNRLNCSANDLMALMNSESGLDSTAENEIGAVGLIQFLPKTAKGLGTTAQELKAMSPEKQLDYVEKFLVEAKKTAGYTDDAKVGPGTLYALTFLPGYAKNDILAEKEKDPNKYYAQNTGLDLDGDGKISKADLARRIEDKSV